MEIKRIIDNKEVTIELSPTEEHEIFLEVRRKIIMGGIRLILYTAVLDKKVTSEVVEVCGQWRTVKFISDRINSDDFVVAIADKFLALPECGTGYTEFVSEDRRPLLEKLIAEAL